MGRHKPWKFYLFREFGAKCRTNAWWDKFTILFRHQIWRVGKVWPAASRLECGQMHVRICSPIPGTCEQGIMRYLNWVSRRYISDGVDGTACALDFRFCTPQRSVIYRDFCYGFFETRAYLWSIHFFSSPIFGYFLFWRETSAYTFIRVAVLKN